MKRRRLTIAIGTILVVAALVYWASVSTLHPPHPVLRLTGITNAVVGPSLTTFSGESTNHASFVQRWLAAGTNAAVFTITNRDTCPIKVFACRFQARGERPTDEQTLALDSPVTYGFYLLQPGQTVTSHVAVIPHPGPWRVAFAYNRHDWQEKSRALWALLRRAPPIQLHSYVVHSDWINE